MNSPLTLPTAPLEHPAMDYAFLRREGIRLLERLGGQLWTDFNTHDPGITILEQLCYAITDLGYRINYDVKDLLAGDEDPYRSLYSPAKVLTTDPVTLNDLRKLVIDVPGVKNAWIEPVEKSDPGLVYDASEGSLYLVTAATAQPPHREPVPLRGLYHILIETDESLGFYPADILPEVNRRLHACRSLAEDFNPPTILPRQSVRVDARVEIGAVEDPERLLAKIYHALASFISPRIHFYTLAEMLDRGKSIDEALDGPALEHGFIDDADLEEFDRKIGLRTSDLLREIMAVSGVTAVSSIKLLSGGDVEDWYLKLDSGSAPFLDREKMLFPEKDNEPTIHLVRHGIPLQLDADRVKKMIEVLQKASGNQPLPESERDVLLAPGKDRNLAQYHSIQHQFPAVYGIGAMGLPESASPERRAQSKQLKAYLMFFDQLLANYFAQLANTKELFSFYSEQPRSYFSQTITDASLKLNEIIVGDQAAHAAKVQSLTETPTGLASPAGRKNRFMNHLLARFAEQFTDYSLLQYALLSQDDLIRDKAAFLRDYHKIGAARGVGFNYTLPVWGSENISGLEKRISRKLGISSYQKQDLAELKADDEGTFHMLEHILLRPRPADREQLEQTPGYVSWQSTFLAKPIGKDPYSHQISFIFPAWVERFKRPGFRELIHKTLREETPAHIHIYVHWLKEEDMRAFEAAHKEWLETAITGRLWDPINVKASDIPGRVTHLELRDARDRMIQTLGIAVPYPLRDVILKFDDTVAFKSPATIQILGGQAGVSYQLCDEDGNTVVVEETIKGEDGKNKTVEKRFEITPQLGDAPILLNTPPIQKDITFTILAIREVPGQNTRLETYLNQPVSIKAGIDTKLDVTFEPLDGQIVHEAKIVASYDEKVTFVVAKTQEGISYELVTGPKDNLVKLSTAKKGNKGDVALVPSAGFNDDIVIKVRAYRTAAQSVWALLDAELTVLVRPNAAVVIDLEKSPVDYQADIKLTLAAPQPGVEYRLYRRDVALAEYLADGSAAGLIVKTDEGRNISVQTPQKVTDWNAPAGFTLVDQFKDSAGNLSVNTGALLEDTLLIVQAAKLSNGELLQLDQLSAILVRPNPACAISVAQDEVIAGTNGLLRVNGTQKGVRYQLRLDADNTLVNPPGYHHTDRALETVRLEVDLVVENQGKDVLLLPTSPITEPTTFNVLAIKNITGVSTPLNEKATLKVQINTGLAVGFQPADGQVARKAQLTANHGDKVTVTVSGSEEGASYVLVTGPQDALVPLSSAIKGDKGEISIISKAGFNEDTPIRVRVYRTADKNLWALLDAELTVLVRPNPAVTISIDTPIIDYGAASTLFLVNHQASVEYHLYKRELDAPDYLSSPAKGDLVVQVDKDRKIAIKAPQKVTAWDDSSGFALVDKFSASAESLSVSTGELLEDTLFIVRATKIENHEQLQLDQAVVLLVRPNPACAVSVAKAEVVSGEPGLVRVNGTQKGVHYQLRLDADNTPVNPPGYHQTDRTIDTVRFDVDFVVESQGQAVLLLPTSAITETTTFNVLAIKTITGISAQLNKKATVGVSAP